MQNMFSRDTRWASPAVTNVQNAVDAVCERYALFTAFTRFLTPRTIEECGGQWKVFYRNCPDMLAGNLPAGSANIIDSLRRFIPPAIVVDRYVYSAFSSPALKSHLTDMGGTTLVVSGVETDMCMQATLMDAVDHGLRSIVVVDAVASSFPDGHHAILDFVAPRFEHQIELVTCGELFANWNP
jgi:nicotinamidase-related amidase